MLKYFFSFIFIWSINSFAQVQSLAEYNRTLLAKIIAKTPLTAKEFKTLRIRLGTEVTSADEAAYKGRELQKLLVYSSLITYFSKNKADEKIILEMWNKYLELPNTTRTNFEIQYLIDVFETGKKNKDPAQQIRAGEYIMNTYMPKSEKKIFFHPILREKCELMVYQRKTAELETCWETEKEFIISNVRLQNVIAREKLLYYYTSLQFRNEFISTVDTILKDESLKPIWPFTTTLQISHKIREGNVDFKAISAELETIKKTENDTALIDKILTALYLQQNKIEKALDTFKGVIESDKQNLAGMRSYNTIAADLFYTKGEYRKSLFYVNKLLEGEELVFEKIQHYFRKQMLAMLLKSSPTPAEVRTQLDLYEKELADLQMDDPLVKALMKTSRLFTEETSVNMTELKQSIVDLKKYIYPNSYVVIMAERAVTHLEEAIENQAQEKKAAAAMAKKPVKAPPGTTSKPPTAPQPATAPDKK